MKNTLKLATLSLVVSVIAATGANAATAVRSFGGANTFDSAASASVKKTAAPAVNTSSRAASVRVTPSAKKTGTVVTPSAPTNTTAGRAAAMPRLSFGSHIGANKVGSSGGFEPSGNGKITADDVTGDKGDALRSATNFGGALLDCDNCVVGKLGGELVEFEIVNE